MTPGARVQAAIGVLDRVLRGAAAERALTAWARGSRYAGSGDRAAVRDHVYDALRRLRSAAWTGGAGDVPVEAMDARAVLAGLLSGRGEDVAALFSGTGHAPAPFALPADPGPMPDAVALDVPDWLRARTGGALDAAFAALRDRAPVTLRVNLARTDRATVIAALAEAAHAAVADPLSPGAIRLEGAARGLTAMPAFRDGLFELQDAGSQALVDRLPLGPDERVLDLCAGGGGKALAMAARGAGPLFVHDAAPARMRDLPVRAARAGAAMTVLPDPDDAAPFDGVVADVPCSGSGAWRRAPEAKWRLAPDRLEALGAVQSDILDRAARLVRPGGWVAYMTCSILPEENAARVDARVERGEESLEDRVDLPLAEGGHDGFHYSLLRRMV